MYIILNGDERKDEKKLSIAERINNLVANTTSRHVDGFCLKRIVLTKDEYLELLDLQVLSTAKQYHGVSILIKPWVES